MATYKNDWVNLNLNEYNYPATDSSYGAVPPLVQAHTIPNVTISTNTNTNTISSGLSGGYTIGATGTSPNTVWTTNTTGAGTYRINDPAVVLGASGRMELKGDGADLTINGKSLKNWMEKVEERLNILTPNPELEKEWDDLRRLGERYRKLEKKCKQKAEMWKQLKKMPAPRPDQF
jgi:hypothetical protein